MEEEFFFQVIFQLSTGEFDIQQNSACFSQDRSSLEKSSMLLNPPECKTQLNVWAKGQNRKHRPLNTCILPYTLIFFVYSMFGLLGPTQPSAMTQSSQPKCWLKIALIKHCGFYKLFIVLQGSDGWLFQPSFSFSCENVAGEAPITQNNQRNWRHQTDYLLIQQHLAFTSASWHTDTYTQHNHTHSSVFL